ncbi:MAG: ribonuclease HII [Fimbriimonadaceae bacterium]|nr:ribonuclease HII [Fimbriimonadaceae bacterium]
MSPSLLFAPHVAGVDEAGRGPLAGPVVVAAVVLPLGFDTQGVVDSKRLTPADREAAFDRIVAAAAWHIEVVGPADIDRHNILRATLAAMSRCLAGLTPRPRSARIDGNALPPDPCCPCEAWVKGDGRDAAVAAASILAKVTRDRLMVSAAEEFPGYGFESNFGYAAPGHLAALRELGPCPLHRRSFEPVKTMVNQPCLLDV